VLFDTFARIAPEPAPLPPPPPATLLLPNARLPQPLQRFRPRDAALGPTPGGPEIAFPPDGAELDAGPALALKVRGGTPPFTWLADGVPIALAERARETALARPGIGYLALSVIDANGRSASATVTLAP
jgi:penicillin-binding protein 1C